MNFYINQDPDVIAPFKDKHPVVASQAACWCGAIPGSCPDCQDCDMIALETSAYHAGKVNVSSGEDADLFR